VYRVNFGTTLYHVVLITSLFALIFNCGCHSQLTGLLPDFLYTLRLGFAETWAPYCHPNSRVFDVLVNGAIVPELAATDVYVLSGGCYTGLVRDTEVQTMASGNATLEFVAFHNAEAFISSIQVILKSNAAVLSPSPAVNF
jgi:Malectin domain